MIIQHSMLYLKPGAVGTAVTREQGGPGTACFLHDWSTVQSVSQPFTLWPLVWVLSPSMTLVRLKWFWYDAAFLCTVMHKKMFNVRICQVGLHWNGCATVCSLEPHLPFSSDPAPPISELDKGNWIIHTRVSATLDRYRHLCWLSFDFSALWMNSGTEKRGIFWDQDP